MTIWDKFLIAATLAAALASVFLVSSAVGNSAPASVVTVKINGVVGQRLPLNRDTAKRISTETGFCVVKIEDGRAGISGTDCPKKLCLSQGSIGAEGGIIVCLPHKIVISADVQRAGGKVDAVVR